MARYAAFLRAVNLGSKRKTPGAELRAAVEELGFEDVATFRTSGNVVFGAGDRAGAAAITAKLEEGLVAAFGFEIPVYLRSESECRDIAGREPFDAKAVARSAGKLQVDLLLKKPSAAARRKVLELGTDDDLLAVSGREVYWLPSGGMSDSGLDLKTIEKLVGPGTRRTMGTIESIVAKFF